MLSNTSNIFEYDFPAFSSPEGRKVELLITSGMQKFMSYDKAKNKLTTKAASEDNVGNYLLTIKLIDDKQ